MDFANTKYVPRILVVYFGGPNFPAVCLPSLPLALPDCRVASRHVIKPKHHVVGDLHKHSNPPLPATFT